MIRYIYIIIILFFILTGCFKKQEPTKFFYTINYETDSWKNHRTALLWTMSYLGAKLPVGSLDKSLIWYDSTTFSIDFSKLGFKREVVEVITRICDSIKATDNYRNTGRADIGSLVALTIGSSPHYYKITEAPENISELIEIHGGDTSQLFVVTKSAVALHQRILNYSKCSNDPRKWMFIAKEGQGDYSAGTFKTEFYEVFDIMENGQLRFMIYDKFGKLANSSPKKFGEAGKPGKCMWCHEIVIQPLFAQNEKVENVQSPDEFQEAVLKFMKNLTDYRKTLKSEVDFEKTQDHEKMELEYIAFMEPNVKKLCQTWSMTEQEVRLVIKGKRGRNHEEFKFLEDVFNRKHIILNERLPASIREPETLDVDFFK